MKTLPRLCSSLILPLTMGWMLTGVSAADPVPAPPVPTVLKIVGSTSADPYTLVTLSVSGVSDKDGILWKVRPLDVGNRGKVYVANGGKKNGTSIEWIGPPGQYQVEVIVGKAGMASLSLDGDEIIFTINGQVTPPPGPLPGPGPAPAPDPKPKPDPPAPDESDAVLIAKLKPLIAAADKADAAKLGEVYYTSGAIMAGLKDPAARPKTFRDVIKNLTDASELAGIPRLPALASLRTVVAAELGDMDAMAPITDQLLSDLAMKYRRMGASLKAAAK